MVIESPAANDPMTQLLNDPNLMTYHAAAAALARVRRHLVQREALRGVPFTVMVVLLMLGAQVRLVLRCEWLTLCPAWGVFPQMSHRAIL